MGNRFADRSRVGCEWQSRNSSECWSNDERSTHLPFSPSFSSLLSLSLSLFLAVFFFLLLLLFCFISILFCFVLFSFYSSSSSSSSFFFFFFSGEKRLSFIHWLIWSRRFAGSTATFCRNIPQGFWFRISRFFLEIWFVGNCGDRVQGGILVKWP